MARTSSFGCSMPSPTTPTANAIAKQITDGTFDLVFTASTVCLQHLVNADTCWGAVHVFGLVTDPYGAGVGIKRDDPLDHPAQSRWPRLLPACRGVAPTGEDTLSRPHHHRSALGTPRSIAPKPALSEGEGDRAQARH